MKNIHESKEEKHWLKPEEISAESGFTVPTVNAYLKLLVGDIDSNVHRKPIYEGSGLNRRVQHYEYTFDFKKAASDVKVQEKIDYVV